MKALMVKSVLLLRVVVILPLLLIVLITFCDVFARYVFSSPILGSAELIKYFMALVIFMSLPLVTLNDEHISVSLMDGIKSRWFKAVKNIVVRLLTILALLLLSYILFKQGYNYYTSGATTLFLGLSLGLLCYVMSFFSLTSALSVVLAMCGCFKRSESEVEGKDS